MTTAVEPNAQLQRELDAHRHALQSFIATAEQVDTVAWNTPSQVDKWSPAQVSEHLRLSYTTVRAELAGGTGFRVRTSWWKQQMFRLLYLPKILKSGRFPVGVRATREIRPAAGPFDQRALLDALRDEGEHFMEELSSVRTDGSIALTHPFLGRLGLLEGLRLATHHIRHHHAQITK